MGTAEVCVFLCVCVCGHVFLYFGGNKKYELLMILTIYLDLGTANN